MSDEFGYSRGSITEEEKLLIMIDQVNNLISCSEGNEWETHLVSHLSPIYFELTRQLSNLHTTLDTEGRSH
jgi:hypothetical protein